MSAGRATKKYNGMTQLYIIELMQIEAEARKYITDAIEIEKEVQEQESKDKAKGAIVTSSNSAE